jgi:hypothetical protein
MRDLFPETSVSDLVKMRKLNAFYNSASRARIYRVLAVFREAGRGEMEAVEQLLKAAVSEGDASRAHKDLIEPLKAILTSLANKAEIGTALTDSLGAISAEETAILAIVAELDGPKAAVALERLAQIAAALKPI